MTTFKAAILCVTVLLVPVAKAATITCTATCILDAKGTATTIQGKGVDQQDAVIQLKRNCDRAAAEVKSSTHYLATSFSKPNAQYTATQTEFDVQKACF